jgi:hypothetical protein
VSRLHPRQRRLRKPGRGAPSTLCRRWPACPAGSGWVRRVLQPREVHMVVSKQSSSRRRA